MDDGPSENQHGGGEPIELTSTSGFGKNPIVQLSGQDDLIKWNLTASGSYSANEVLSRFGRSRQREKVKFYVRLLLQNRNWTADRLGARNWSHNNVCSLCDREPEAAVQK